jgi:hypothetical protein
MFLIKFLPFIIFISFESYAHVETEISTYSNFIWRGTTFSENRPVIQLTADSETKSGFFISGFASNAEFSDEAMGKNSQVTQEVDLGFGKRWKFQTSEIQFSYNRFLFPGAQVFESDEMNLYFNISRFILELSFMDDYFGYEGAYRYIRLGHEWNYTKSLGGTIFIGYNSFDNPKGKIKTRGDAQTTTGAGNPDYIDIYFTNRKILNNDLTIELAINWTNRYEYSVQDDLINKEKANDFAVILGLSYPFNL